MVSWDVVNNSLTESEQNLQKFNENITIEGSNKFIRKTRKALNKMNKKSWLFSSWINGLKNHHTIVDVTSKGFPPSTQILGKRKGDYRYLKGTGKGTSTKIELTFDKKRLKQIAKYYGIKKGLALEFSIADEFAGVFYLDKGEYFDFTDFNANERGEDIRDAYLANVVMNHLGAAPREAYGKYELHGSEPPGHPILQSLYNLFKDRSMYGASQELLEKRINEALYKNMKYYGK